MEASWGGGSRSVQSVTAFHNVRSWSCGEITMVAKAVSSLGTMFLVTKADMAALLNTSFQGNRINLADRSVGDQEERAEESLFLIVGKTMSRRLPSGGSQGCSHV